MTTSRRDFLRIGGLAAMAGSAGILHPAEQMPVGEEIKRLRFPGPLRSGDVIGITSPSAGVKPALRPRMQFAYQTLIRLGYGYREGQCLWGKSLLSAPAPQRAEELMRMLLDDSIGAVFPPNGGELLIDMLPFIDFDVLARAQPKWILGYSDMSTFMLPYTLKTGIATLSGTNLWECPIRPTDPNLAYWDDVVRLPPGSGFEQRAATRFQNHDSDWAKLPPHVTHFRRRTQVRWQCLHQEDNPGHAVTVSGRLIGGTLDVIGPLAGSDYADVRRFAREYAPEGLLIFVDNCDFNTAQYCRGLHQLRLAGWFESANAILIGRTAAKTIERFTQRDALLDALGHLDIPVFYDLDIGHLPPQMMLVNGALATLTFAGEQKSLVQTLS